MVTKEIIVRFQGALILGMWLLMSGCASDSLVDSDPTASAYPNHIPEIVMNQSPNIENTDKFEPGANCEFPVESVIDPPLLWWPRHEWEDHLANLRKKKCPGDTVLSAISEAERVLKMHDTGEIKAIEDRYNKAFVIRKP